MGVGDVGFGNFFCITGMPRTFILNLRMIRTGDVSLYGN